MKAWVLHGIDDIRYETVKKPDLAENEVLVRVKAAGICGSDIPRIYKTGAHMHPLIPGHEFSGVVEEAGKKADKKWIGKKVGIFPLLPCYQCIACQNKQYEMCRNYSYLGSRRDGGFAEYAAVPQKNLIELPENVSFEAAAMLEPMAVAVHAMRRTQPQVLDTVLVYGLGTIGMLLVMFLKEAGIKNILAVGNKEAQRQAVLQLGLAETCYCDSSKQDVSKWLMERTAGIGVNVLFECIGKQEIVSALIDAAAPAGKILLLGNPFSDVHLEKAVYWEILRKQLTVSGTWNSSFTGEENDDWKYVIERLANKQLQPEQLITHQLMLKDLDKGLWIMRDKSEEYMKIMIHA